MARAWKTGGALLLCGCARSLTDDGMSIAPDGSPDSPAGNEDGGQWTHEDGGSFDANAWGEPDAATFDANVAFDALPPSACNGKTRVMTTADLFIGDFEGGGLQGWYDYGANGALNALAVGSPGAISTAHAGHLAATGLTGFGGGMGFGTGCWDTSALDGISFWAKGIAGADNKVQFQVAIPATHAVANGGDCLSKCFDHPSKVLVLTPAWTQYVVAFSELAQAGWGAPASYKGVIMAVNWVSVDAANVDFWVDEVALYRGTASPNPVGHGGPVDAGPKD
jgi:hypothetical protein